jgi:hypothetical protein
MISYVSFFKVLAGLTRLTRTLRSCCCIYSFSRAQNAARSAQKCSRSACRRLQTARKHFLRFPWYALACATWYWRDNHHIDFVGPRSNAPCTALTVWMDTGCRPAGTLTPHHTCLSSNYVYHRTVVCDVGPLVLNSLFKSRCTRITLVCFAYKTTHFAFCWIVVGIFVYALLPTTLNKTPCFLPCLRFFETSPQWFIHNKFSCLHNWLWGTCI